MCGDAMLLDGYRPSDLVILTIGGTTSNFHIRSFVNFSKTHSNKTHFNKVHSNQLTMSFVNTVL